ncbi:hypothetical protein [Mycobacterium sp.]|uniref:hypothetical protein n=1 Tax=Mycobacterium sp. TaxID=1785 RepID=UPI00128289E9|nr:hypothetical protein [Mycobacterium sp.]KAA8946831.1 MAG: hypothetical protein F6Q13_18555 [Mycobacterium sp.]
MTDHDQPSRQPLFLVSTEGKTEDEIAEEIMAQVRAYRAAHGIPEPAEPDGNGADRDGEEST